jgi:hypothetical protein
MNFGPDQYGFSRNTNVIVSNDFGQTWGSSTSPFPANADPANFKSILNDPFPVRSDGTRFDTPTRDALGSMARVGRSFGFTAWDVPHARQQRWQAGMQRQFGASMVVSASYAGSYSDRISLGQNLSPMPEQYWVKGLKRDVTAQNNWNQNVTNPFYIGNFKQADFSPLVWADMNTNSFFTSRTISKNRLVRAFPHMNGLTNNTESSSYTKTHELQVSFEKRFAQGWNLNLAYTGMRLREADFFMNEFETKRTERPSNDGRPHRFTGTGVYTIPFGKGRRFLGDANRAVDTVLGGWQIAATYEWQPNGLVDWGNIFYYGSDANNVRNVDRNWDNWFNTADFERTAANGPAGYHVRVFPTRIPGLRADSTNQWNANVSKNLRLTERVNMQLRFDALNVQNRSQMAGPNTDPYSTNFGRITSQTSATNRWLQIQARVTF